MREQFASKVCVYDFDKNTNKQKEKFLRDDVSRTDGTVADKQQMLPECSLRARRGSNAGSNQTLTHTPFQHTYTESEYPACPRRG